MEIKNINNGAKCQKRKPVLVKSAGPVQKRGRQEAADDEQEAAAAKVMPHDPVKRYDTKKYEKRIKNNIYKITAKTKAVEYRFNPDIGIVFQIVPIRGAGGKKAAKAGAVAIVKEAGDVLPRVGKQDFCFFQTFGMEHPGVGIAG